MSDARLIATVEQWTWKTPAMKAMTLAVCRLALARAKGGPAGADFSANDLADFNHGGRGICGTVFGRLAEDGVIAPVGHFLDGAFQQKTVKNAGGNRIGVWRLECAARAERLLAVHGLELPRYKQVELV